VLRTVVKLPIMCSKHWLAFGNSRRVEFQFGLQTAALSAFFVAFSMLRTGTGSSATTTLGFDGHSRGAVVSVKSATRTEKISVGMSEGSAGLGSGIALNIPAEAMTVTNESGTRDYYLGPRGDDLNDGSADRPWRTIQHAARVVRPGTTVHIAPGEYQVAVVTKISGTAAGRIRFVSDVQWAARVRTKGASASWLNEGNFVDIIGFDISGDGSLGIDNEASHVRVLGNRVHDIPATGCTSNGGAGIDDGNYFAHDDDVIGNVVFGIGDVTKPCPRVHGIYHANLRGHVYNNLVYLNQGWGIHTWEAASHVEISNNTVFNNGYGGIVIGAGDFPHAMNDYTRVTNNISIYNGNYGIEEYGRTGVHNVYANNLVYLNAVGNFDLQNGNTDQNSVFADPQFVEYRSDGTGNYRLSMDSPGIDAGTRRAAPGYDMNGGERPFGKTWDIGAYEYHSRAAQWLWY